MLSTTRSAGAASTRRLRVLVIAEMCNPAWVSTPLGGWSCWRAISRLVDGHLVTHSRNEADLRAAALSPSQFTALDSTPLERHVDRLWDLLRLGGKRNAGWSTYTALSVLSYRYFERLVWERFGDLIAGGRFDLVHRLTPVSPAVPSPLAARCAAVGVPFVLGPINGGLAWPKGFRTIAFREKEWLSFFRGAHRLVPGYASTRRDATAIMVGSRTALAELPPWARRKAVYVPGNAVEPGRFDAPARAPVAPPLRIAFVGRFTRIKGADMLLEAAAPMVRAGRAVLDLVGEGPAMAELREIALREAIAGGVTFAGWVPHQELHARLSRSHVFAFPSIREYGGAVVLEAMALGLVPVVVDYGGPPELVSPGTGLTVPLGRREEIVAGLRAALERLANDPDAVRTMGLRARERVLRHFTWEAKAGQVLEVYRWALGERDRPDFGMPLADAEAA
jgi:glycosyltransferase involved in cell wall biosynthesis